MTPRRDRHRAHTVGADRTEPVRRGGHHQGHTRVVFLTIAVTKCADQPGTVEKGIVSPHPFGAVIAMAPDRGR